MSICHGKEEILQGQEKRRFRKGLKSYEIVYKKHLGFCFGM